MGLARALVGGAIGGGIGIIVWVLVGYFAHYEIGWIAWGIGFLVGMGVRYASFLGNENEQPGVAKGALAAVMAIGSILLAKYIVFALLTGGIDRVALNKAVNEMRFDDEAMIVGLANQTAIEMEKQGKKVAWPAGMNADEATQKSHYPADVWRQAETKWQQLGPAGQQQRKQDYAKLIAGLSEIAKEPNFSESFSAMDALWFGLAVFTAFRIGVGAYGSKE